MSCRSWFFKLLDPHFRIAVVGLRECALTAAPAQPSISIAASDKARVIPREIPLKFDEIWMTCWPDDEIGVIAEARMISLRAEYAKNVTETNGLHKWLNGPKQNRRPKAPATKPLQNAKPYELAFSTVTARRFCDQHEMSLQTATGRSLP